MTDTSLQVLDGYNNSTYVNGMVGSIYKQAIPLANASRKPGEWQTYDVAWTAPTFNDDGSVKTREYATVFLNGVLVENHFELKGQTLYIGKPFYKKYDTAPIKLQAPRRQERAHELQEYMGARAAVAQVREGIQAPERGFAQKHVLPKDGNPRGKPLTDAAGILPRGLAALAARRRFQTWAPCRRRCAW